MKLRIFIACTGLLNEDVGIQKDYFDNIMSLYTHLKSKIFVNLCNDFEDYFYKETTDKGIYNKSSFYRDEFEDNARACNVFVAIINDPYLNELRDTDSNCYKELKAFLYNGLYPQKIITIDLRAKKDRNDFKEVIKGIVDGKDIEALGCNYYENPIGVDGEFTDEDKGTIKHHIFNIRSLYENLQNIYYVDIYPVSQNLIDYDLNLKKHKAFHEIFSKHVPHLKEMKCPVIVSPNLYHYEGLDKKNSDDKTRINRKNEYIKYFLEKSEKLIILWNSEMNEEIIENHLSKALYKKYWNKIYLISKDHKLFQFDIRKKQLTEMGTKTISDEILNISAELFTHFSKVAS